MSEQILPPHPWVIGRKAQYGTYSPDQIFDALGNRLATVYGIPLHTRMEELNFADNRLQRAMAIARTLAAAPELYAALNAIVSDLPSKRDWLDPDIERMARAALAKAEGKATT